MKNFLFYAFLILSMIACSTDDVDSTKNIETADLLASRPPCSGFDIFENKQFDCGFKRGLSDWTVHYNTTAQAYNHPICSRINLVVVNSSSDFGTADEETAQQDAGEFIRLESQEYSNSFEIIRKARRDFRNYFNALHASDPATRSDWERGKIAGYMAFYGSEPLAADGGTCQ